MAERFAVRNIRLCTKDCLCLYVCPTGASDTENSVIDRNKCIGCGACAESCPSGAISMVPKTLPPQQKKGEKTVAALNALAANKLRLEQAATGADNRLFAAAERSSRLMAEDLLREAGYMLPQSRNARDLVEKLLENAGPDFPRAAAEKLMELLETND